MSKKASRQPPTCARCGNLDDLEAIDGTIYCLPCRTCPHGRVYSECWLNPCWACVRDLHTMITFEGPRIRDVIAYVRSAAEEWGLGYTDIVPHTYEEMTQVPYWEKALPCRRAPIAAPPHHIKEGLSVVEGVVERVRQ